MIPAPNRPGLTNNLVGSVPLLDDNHRADGKLDHRFNEKSTGYFRYGYTQGSVDQGSLLGMVGSPSSADLRAMNAAGSYTQVFTTDLMTEIRVGYDRYRNQISPWGNFSALNGSLTGFPSGLPYLNISGFSPLGFSANVPRKEVDNVFEGTNDWLYHTGMHSLKLGVEARELQSSGFTSPYFSSLGSFVFGPGATSGGLGIGGLSLNPAVLQANSLAAFLIGAPTQAGVSSFMTTPAYRQRQYGAYLTDTINLYKRVYLELGVRYDIFNPIEPAQAGGAVAYDPGSNTVTTLGVNGVGIRSTRTDLNNVAPRIGFAYRPVDRLVFRAGYGIHYFPVPFALAPYNPAMEGVQSGIAGGYGVTSFTVPAVPASGTSAPNMPFVYGSRNPATPYVQTYSGMLQGDMGRGFLLDIGYVGNLGRELPYSVPQVGMPGTGIAGLLPGRTAVATEVGTGLTSNYNSLQVNLTKKFAGGLAISGAYTYSKALDYGSALLDTFNRASNYGPADWDRTHNLTATYVWRLPFGQNSAYMKSGLAARILGDWEFTGVLRWSTGTPYSVTADPLACGCLGAASVPAAYIGGGSINGSASFNPGLFAEPTSGTFGALSRNGFRGPDFFVYNTALFRNFTINQNVKFELRGEAYNVTNTTNPGNPVANAVVAGFGTEGPELNGLAGRQFQVAARILF
jgi:hypothetical protein